MSHTNWAATFHTLHFGSHAWSKKTQHVWCPAGLRGLKMRDGKAQSCSEQRPRSSHPPRTTAHIHLLMEPHTRCCLSNLNSGWFTTVVLPYSDWTMAQPWLSTSLEGELKTSWCFWPPWRIISKDYAPSMVLAPQAWCLACPCQEHRAISQSFQMTLLWVLGTLAPPTQQPLRRWDQSLADAHKRFGLELIQVPWSHPVPCLGKTSTDENGSMTRGREGKGMVSMWKKAKYHTKLFHGWMVLLGRSGIKW